MSGTACQHSACYCKKYVESTSKWSKGKCKNCDHSLKMHATLEVNISFDDKGSVAPPKSSTSNTNKWQVDTHSGIVPSGKTNFQSNKPQYQQPKPKPQPQVSVVESDWINWDTEQLFAWFLQKRKLPSELDSNGILRQMQSQKVAGDKLTTLTQSLMLSYGFKDYNHRSRMLDYVKVLLQQYPPAAQTRRVRPVVKEVSNSNSNRNNDETKTNETAKFRLDESTWQQWTASEVFEWLRFKLDWMDDAVMDFIKIDRVNSYQTKCLSQGINLTGQRLPVSLENNYALLKQVGFHFSERKMIVQNVQKLMAAYPN